MRDYLLALLLGVVEGVTEFLPVSSTAHLRLVQSFFVRLDDPFWTMFSIVIQLGAILSVVVYFRHRIATFIRTFPRGENNDHTWWNHPLSLVLISFVVTALPCYLIDKRIGKNLESLPIIGAALLIGGVVMAIVDKWFNHPRTDDPERMTLPQAIVIGAAQIVAAAFPGTSRSMATIAAGQIMGLSRHAALEFSFYLAIPVMFAATGYKLLQFLHGSRVPMSGHQWGVLAVGLIVSFLVALAAVAWFMHWVRKHGFIPFAVYRIALGAVVLIWLIVHG